MRQASIAYAGNDTGLAKKQYEAAARQFFEATIATVRAMRPGCRLGWYGYPTNSLPHTVDAQWRQYCETHPDSCAFDRGGPGTDSGYAGPGAVGQREVNDGLGWLWSSLDILTPSIYLGIAPKPPGSPAVDTHATEVYVGSTVKEAARLAARWKKAVVPVAWMSYDDYWDKSINASAPRALLAPADAELELSTPFQHGAAGLLVWGHLDPTGADGMATFQRYADEVIRPAVDRLCSNYTCCKSLEACFPRGAAALGNTTRVPLKLDDQWDPRSHSGSPGSAPLHLPLLLLVLVLPSPA